MEMETDTNERQSSVPILVKEQIEFIFAGFVKENLENKKVIIEACRNTSQCFDTIDQTSKYLTTLSKSYFPNLMIDRDDFYCQLLLERTNFCTLGMYSLKDEKKKMNGMLVFLLSNIFRSILHKDNSCNHPFSKESGLSCQQCSEIKNILETFTSKHEFIGSFLDISKNFYNKFTKLCENLAEISNGLSNAQAKLYGSFLAHFLSFRKK
jgi:hypothetical protein